MNQSKRFKRRFARSMVVKAIYAQKDPIERRKMIVGALQAATYTKENSEGELKAYATYCEQTFIDWLRILDK